MAAPHTKFDTNIRYNLKNNERDNVETVSYRGFIDGFHQFIRTRDGFAIPLEEEELEFNTIEPVIEKKLFPEGGRRKQRRRSRSLRKTRGRRSRHTRRRK
jgi:hypothetical protein